MARHASLATVIEKNRIASDVAFIMLAEVDVRNAAGTLVETLYFARNSEDFVYGGKTYVSAGFNFGITESATKVEQITLELRDPSLTVARRLDQYDGGAGWKIRLILVNTANTDQPPEFEQSAYVMGSTIKGYGAALTLGTRNPIRARFPARVQWRDRCAWAYKSTECGYTGPLPTCDYSLQGDNGCAAHDNTHRFGGFPGLRNRA